VTIFRNADDGHMKVGQKCLPFSFVIAKRHRRPSRPARLTGERIGAERPALTRANSPRRFTPARSSGLLGGFAVRSGYIGNNLVQGHG
jgi:hypothetical protein